MAKIPVYQRQFAGSDTLQAPRQGMSTPAAAFGGGIGKSLVNMGNAVADGANKISRVMIAHQKKMQEEKWEAEADKAFTDFSIATDKRLYEDEDAYFNNTLGDADGLTNRFLADYDKRYIEASKNMDPEVARRFKKRIDTAKRSNAKMVARQEAGEMRKFRAFSAESAGVAASRSIAAAWSDDPDNIDKRFTDEAEGKLREAARLSGKNPDEVVRAAQDKMYGQIIEQHIAVGATNKAKALTGRWDEKITPERRETISAAIHKKELLIDGDNRAESLFAGVRSGKLTRSEAERLMSDIDDPDVRQHTRAAFRPLTQAWRLEQQELTIDLQNKAISTLDGMQGDFKAQYDHIQNMPDETEPQKDAKKFAEKVYTQNIKKKGISAKSDPAAFDAGVDKIAYGEITTEKALRVFGAENGLVKSDVDFLVRGLKNSQTLKGLKDAYLTSSGTKKGSAKNKQDYRDFMVWAQDQAKQSNRAMEPDYVQKLADQWFLKGESPTNDNWHMGYGQDTPFSKAATDPAWLPDIVGDNTTQGQSNTMALTRSKADMIRRNMKPEVLNAWVNKAGGNTDLAIRMFWKQHLKRELGKVTRPKEK